MEDDIRKLEKIILNMRPSGIIQTQIVDALKSILWIFQQSRPQDKIPATLSTTIEELKKQTGGTSNAAKPVTTSATITTK
jgi:hypothetical protein